MNYLLSLPILGLLFLFAMALVGTPNANSSEEDWDDYLELNDE